MMKNASLGFNSGIVPVKSWLLQDPGTKALNQAPKVAVPRLVRLAWGMCTSKVSWRGSQDCLWPSGVSPLNEL